MKIFGFEVKRQKNAIRNSGRAVKLGDVLRNINGKIKIDTDVFFELYIRNGDLRQGIQKIAKHVGKKGFYLEDERGNVINEGSDYNSKVALFSKPTPLNWRIEFFRNLIVSGDVYIVPEYNGFNQVAGFRFLDPRTMSVKYSKENGEVVGYTQWIQGNKIEFTTEELKHYYFESNPNNAYLGLSLLEGPVMDLLSDKESAERNQASIKDGYLTEAIIKIKSDEDLNPDDVEIAMEKIKSELEAPGRKYITSNVVEGVERLSFSPRDIDYINQRALTVDKICSAIGVPKSIIGYTESVNYANGNSQWKEFIEGTIIPYQDFLTFVMNDLYDFFVKGKKQSARIVLVNDTAEMKTETEKGQREDIKLGILSIDEVRRERKYPEWKIKGKTDTPLIVSNIAPLTQEQAQ